MTISVSTPMTGPHSGTNTTMAAAYQNLKTIILTNPGERNQDGNFGVGLSHMLFEQDNPNLRADLRQRISSQLATYAPFVQLLGIQLSAQNSLESSLRISIKYAVRIGTSSSDMQEINFTYDGERSSVDAEDRPMHFRVR